MSAADKQVPGPGGIALDHVAHWVPDIEPASRRMEQLGFTLTPYSSQRLPPKPGDAPAPAGTGNRCIMLGEGYIEVLGVEKGAETPNAKALREGMARYVGLHIVCFGEHDPERVVSRLKQNGFDPPPAVALSRKIGTPDGEGLARFSVVRAAPGGMAEGRIQYCIHHTPELLWQERWVNHPNGAQALASVIIVVGDLEEAVGRYERFLGRKPERRPDQTAVFRLDRGTAMLGGPNTPRSGNAPLPFVAAYGVRVRDLKETERFLDAHGVTADKSVAGVISVDGGPSLGGTIVFHQ
ncbi:MAG: VOC family protein [Alphaproteobacteria bacterium]|nr:VOC family protein [Alphaproteobacteria bacterium]